MGRIKVIMDPGQREEYINMLLELDGLSHIKEDPLQAYTPISLTSTPEELKDILKSRQSALKSVLGKAGIKVYDPGTSKDYNPDLNLEAEPYEVYNNDSARVLGSRFFSGHMLVPSTGQGNEAEKAKFYNRISVTLMDKKVRVSRMQPIRAIYLQYENFGEQANDFAKVFEFLKGFDPGMGFNDEIPVLLGFEKSGKHIVDLEETVYREFPDLQYKYDGNTPILKLRAENPELFYELR